MILLDTDHLTILKYPANPRCTSLIARLEASQDEEIGTTIISVEEQWRARKRQRAHWAYRHERVLPAGDIKRRMRVTEQLV